MIFNTSPDFYPDRGEVRVFGQPLHGPGGAMIGYLPEERGLYRKMNVHPLLEFFGELRGWRNVPSLGRVAVRRGGGA
jgi:ABC-2 type transport system ATP-binding protein